MAHHCFAGKCRDILLPTTTPPSVTKPRLWRPGVCCLSACLRTREKRKKDKQLAIPGLGEGSSGGSRSCRTSIGSSALVGYADIDSTTIVASISRNLTKISKSAYRDGGFHVFGFVINTDGGSTSFGATTAYKLLRQRQATVRKSTTREYESRLHVLQMELDGLNASEVVKSRRTRDLERVRPRVTEDGDVEGDRDSTCKFIKDCLVKDLLDILVVRNQLTVQDATSSSQTMKWTAWADYAYDRLENWDNDMALNGKYPKKGFNINFFQERENERVVPALDARHFPEDDNADREELAEKAMRIVSWTEDEMAVSLEKQGDVPIIQTVSGVTVASVSSAGKWEKAVKGKHEKAEKERKKKSKGKGKEKESRHGL
ncbi:hypothetical protein B0H14DRAFT_3779534 [Mycena olivaceomarginata]|nr:hypothetical protein B0H14DRAFT_3779534 [Mycena olivaceomarginata]